MIYVCIRCRFHYGPVAQVRSFQEHRGDLIKLSLITGHTGSRGKTTDGGRERVQQREKREGGEREREKAKKEGDRGGIFTTWTHTPHPRGESKLQSALQDRGGSQTGVHLKDEWERKRGAGGREKEGDGRKKCEYMFADNCGQL